MNMYIDINLLVNEELKLILWFQNEMEIYLKRIIIIILQKLIKNLCKTIKTIALTDKCSSCDD